jgi:TonB family protein
MELKLRWVQISFAVHALVILIAMNVGGLKTPANKPLIIDLSLDYNTSKNGSQKPVIKPQQTPLPRQTSAPAIQASPLPVTVQASEINYAVNASDISIQNKNTLANDSHKAPVAKNNIDSAVNSSKSYTAEDRYVKVNFTYIRDIIQKNIAYPHMARKRGLEGKVVVSFIVCADGEAQDITITESSGFEVLDRSAVEAVRKASPFPKPPVKAALIIPVVYKLN